MHDQTIGMLRPFIFREAATSRVARERYNLHIISVNCIDECQMRRQSVPLFLSAR